MKKIITIIIALVVLFGGYSPNIAQAQSKILQQYEYAAGGAGFTAAQDPKMALISWLRIAYGFIGVILLSICVYAGWLRFTAGGNDEAVDKSNKYFLNATIGLIIIFSSYIITIYAYRLSSANTKYSCASDAQCGKKEKCNLYGQCVDNKWCETSADCRSGEKCTAGYCESAGATDLTF